MDGLPGWANLGADGLPAGTPRVGATPTPARAGRPPKLWSALAAAVEADLFDRSLLDVSETLNLHDHEHLPDGAAGPRARGAERARRVGRELLCILGAWPWAHADGGVLPPDWRSQQKWAAPLREWVDAASAELRLEIERAQNALPT